MIIIGILPWVGPEESMINIYTYLHLLRIFLRWHSLLFHVLSTGMQFHNWEGKAIFILQRHALNPKFYVKLLKGHQGQDHAGQQRPRPPCPLVNPRHASTCFCHVQSPPTIPFFIDSFKHLGINNNISTLLQTNSDPEITFNGSNSSFV